MTKPPTPPPKNENEKCQEENFNILNEDIKINRLDLTAAKITCDDAVKRVSCISYTESSINNHILIIHLDFGTQSSF